MKATLKKQLRVQEVTSSIANISKAMGNLHKGNSKDKNKQLKVYRELINEYNKEFKQLCESI